MKRLLLAGAAVLVLTAAKPTLAADAPVYKGPAPRAEALFNWSGFYIGGDIGYAWSKIRGEFLPNNPGSFFAADPNAGIAGIHGGLQYQFSNIVIGVEARYSATFSGSLGAIVGGDFGAPCSLVAAQECEGNIRNIWQVGGRLGWAADRFLVYVTGGWAQANIETHYANITPYLPASGASASHPGWFVGVGIDYAWWNNVIFGLEYQHYEFNSAAHNGGPPQDFRTVSAKTDAVRARLTVKFP